MNALPSPLNAWIYTPGGRGFLSVSNAIEALELAGYRVTVAVLGEQASEFLATSVISICPNCDCLPEEK